MSYNAYNNAFSNAVEDAVRNDNWQLLESLLSKNGDLGAEDGDLTDTGSKASSFTTNRDGANLLMLAAKYGAINVFNKLMIIPDFNINIDKTDKDGNNILHYLFSNADNNGELSTEKFNIYALLRNKATNIYRIDCISELIDQRNNSGISPFLLLRNKELIRLIEGNCSEDLILIKADNLSGAIL